MTVPTVRPRRHPMKLVSGALLVTAVFATSFSTSPPVPQQAAPTTPAEIVATYNSLADAILAVKKTEHDLVVAMLAGAYRHAEAKINAATQKLASGGPAKEDVEGAAALVAQL